MFELEKRADTPESIADKQKRLDEIDLMITTSMNSAAFTKQQYNYDAKQLHLFLDQFK